MADGHGATLLCTLCADKAYPKLKLGGLTRAFERPRLQGVCPHCGWTSEQAKQSGLVGCPLCYESLDPAIWPDFGIHVLGV